MDHSITPRLTALTEYGLNVDDFALQVDMLKAGEFHFDRIPRAATSRAADALVKAGLVTTWESGSNEAQYTAINFRITDLGRQALAFLTRAT